MRRFIVDLKGIDRRAIQITRGGTGVGAFFLSRDGRTVYFSVGGFGGSVAAADAADAAARLQPASLTAGLYSVEHRWTRPAANRRGHVRRHAADG